MRIVEAKVQFHCCSLVSISESTRRVRGYDGITIERVPLTASETYQEIHTTAAAAIAYLLCASLMDKNLPQQKR